jgi:hypothetical protein
MYILASFLSQRKLLHLFGGMLCLMALSIGALGTKETFAKGGNPIFSVEPVLFSPYSPTTRGYFTYTAYPSTQLQDGLQVINTGSVRGTLQLYPVDATTGASSGTEFLSATAPRHDVGAWIKFSQQQVTLNPGQSQDVPFTLTLPAKMRPGQHGGGIVAEVLKQQQQVHTDAKSTTITIGIQSLLTLGVLVNVPGPTVEKLKAVTLRYDTDSQYQRLSVGLENTGTQLLHPTGNLQIRSSDGRLFENIPLKLDTFLPQTAIDYPIYIHNKPLPVGKNYLAQLFLHYEHNHTLNYSTTFEVPVLLKKTVPPLLSHLVTANTVDFFNFLTSWRCLAGIFILFLLLNTLFFWGLRIHKQARNKRDWQRKSKPNQPD